MEADLDYIATLVKLDLLEQFGGRYKFDPVIAERRVFVRDDEVKERYTVRIAHSPSDPMPDAGIVNGISKRLRMKLLKMRVAYIDAELIPAREFKMPDKEAYCDSPDVLVETSGYLTSEPIDHRLIPWAESKPDLNWIAALVKMDLLEQFGDRYKFDPVIAERRLSHGYDEPDEYYAVWVGYSGCSKRPDAKIKIGISDRIRKDLYKMGLTYVSTQLVPADQLELTREMEGDGTG